MTKQIRAETQEIVPRYYGLNFLGEGNIRIFDNPSTAALAYVLINSPYTKGGLIDMLKEWRDRKKMELEGKAEYNPLFKLSTRQANKFLNCSIEKLVEIVREAIKKNHGSYNLWEASGQEAVSNLVLRGETLTADVKSQREGKYKVILKGAVRGKNGEIRYADSTCLCDDNYWAQTKGGQTINARRNCLHIKSAETDSYLQDTREQSPSRHLMKEKNPHSGERSISFNFYDDPFLRPLIADVLIAREVIGENAYSIDRKLLSPKIAPVIMPFSLQEEVARGRAAFEVLKQKRKTRKIDPNILATQNIINEAFSKKLNKAGYSWQGHCLELGREADRYENGEYAISIIMGELPFYVIRKLKGESVEKVSIFKEDHYSQDPLEMILIAHNRMDDRTRKITPCFIQPAVKINFHGIDKPEYLRDVLPTSVLNSYRQEIRKKSKSPETVLKNLGIKN